MKNRNIIVGMIAAVIVCTIVALTPENWPPCETEDSNECYWDGGPNNKGTHYIAVNDNLIITLP